MTSKTRMLTLLVFFSILPCNYAEKAEKTIKISKESYSDIYPVVWFNPDLGTIHKLIAKSEKSPMEGASIWIEPNDPKFAIGPNIKNVAIYQIGKGEEVYQKASSIEGLEKISKIKQRKSS